MPVVRTVPGIRISCRVPVENGRRGVLGLVFEQRDQSGTQRMLGIDCTIIINNDLADSAVFLKSFYKDCFLSFERLLI